MTQLKKWTLEKSQTLLQDRWIHLKGDRCITSRGAILDPFYVLNPKEWVLVIAFSQSGQIILVRQYRHGIREILEEFPAGMIDSGETPLQAASRELAEETGFINGKFEYLTKVPTNPTNSTGYFHIILARDLDDSKCVAWDETEDLEIVLRSQSEVESMIYNGEFVNPHHIAAYFLAQNRYKLLK